MLDQLMTMLELLESVSGEVKWGVFIRVYGLLFVFALGMLYWQIQPWAGSKGLFPIRNRLLRIQADYPSPIDRMLRFPSLHWFWHSDQALKNMLLGSSVIGFLCVVCGLHSRLGLMVMWMVYLSFANMVGFFYPWDCLLLESAFLTVFLPTVSMNQLALKEMPLPIVSFAFRLLLFRVLFGFGKFKFIGASLKEFSYLRGFMINQPMPTVFGWILYHLPLPVHIFSLAIFFVSEMIVPFFYFSTGIWRLVAALITMKLMLVIQVTGNFGFFNVLTAILCIPVMDGVDTLFAKETLYQMVFAHGWSELLINSTFIFLILLSVCFFPFNSWCTMTFFLWPSLSLPVNPVGTLLRRLSPFHLVHAFGVFFPHSSAGVRWIPIIEGTCDERIEHQHETNPDSIVWEEYEYKYMTTRTDRMPPFCAPYHERLDQAILYESIGMTPETYLGTLSSGNLYDFNPNPGSSMLSRVCSCLLQGHKGVEGLFRNIPFSASASSAAPNTKHLHALRVSFYVYSPTSFSELLRTRQFWHKKYIGLHVPIITKKMVVASMTELKKTGYAPENYAEWQIREPEMGHPESYISIADTPVVKELHQRMDRMLAVNKSDGFNSTSLLVTQPSSSSSSSDHSRLQPITTAQVDHELWGTTGFIARCQPLISTLKRPVSSTTSPTQPQLDFEFHLPAGVWSRTITQSLRSKDSPLSGLSAAEVYRLEKMMCRTSMLLLHRLLPLHHRPGPDEKLACARVKVAGYDGVKLEHEVVGGKTGKYCLVPCQRDSCQEGHLHFSSFFNLYLFTHHLVSQGREVYEAILLEPKKALAYQSSFSIASTLLFHALFHPTILAYHASKIRMISKISFSYQLEGGGILPGFLAIHCHFLHREYRSREEGAINPTEVIFPTMIPPQAYDQYWIVKTEELTIRKAPGLVETSEWIKQEKKRQVEEKNKQR